MTYQEWRKRTINVSTETLLQRAYTILQEWNNLDDEQAQHVCRQKDRETGKNDSCWEESITSATLNFINWGI
jgi:hypothetical protein